MSSECMKLCFGENGLAGTELTMAPAVILLLGPSRI